MLKHINLDIRQGTVTALVGSAESADSVCIAGLIIGGQLDRDVKIHIK